MQLNKTKLAGIISLLFCSSSIAATTPNVVVDVVATNSDQSSEYSFGPFATAMDTASSATATATLTQAYAQPFWYDLGAPWTYNEYCDYNSDLCESLWDGTSKGAADGIYLWRQNILNTFTLDSGFSSESEAKVVNSTAVFPQTATDTSNRITAISGDDVVGYTTVGGQSAIENNIARRGFYNEVRLAPVDFTDGSEDKDLNGFTTAYSFTDIALTNFTKRIVVGQTSVNWGDANKARFNACYSALIDDDRFDYDDLYYCPGFNLQASFWEVEADGTVSAEPSLLTTKWLTDGDDIFSNDGTTESSTYTAAAYEVNTSGYAVGFTTENRFNDDNAGYNFAALFTPAVSGAGATAELTYTPVEIAEVGDDISESDYKDDLLNTVAVDITDTVFMPASGAVAAEFAPADGTTDAQGFIVVGNRKLNAGNNNGNLPIEFFAFNIADKSIKFPLKNKPFSGANSRIAKINNAGLAVGWRDDYGENQITYGGSPRFQAAFVYDYTLDKAVYLNDLYCASQASADDVKYRFTNAISITEVDGSDNVTILANGYDYKNVDNYKNKSNSTPVVLKMTLNKSDIVNDEGIQQCPVAESDNYSRSGASMNGFLIFPMLILFFRRFKR